MKHLTMLLAAVVLFAGAQALDAGITDLNTLDTLATGNHSFTADSQTFDAYVRNDGGTGWLLVGRGRNGWQFDNDGQGAVSAVSQNLGTPAAFAPAMYSNAIVNDLIGNSGTDLTDVEIRIRRAADSGGVNPYQEARWRPTLQTTWTGDFDAGSGYGVVHEIVSGLASPAGPVASNTRDAVQAGNNFTRIFTWAWGGHGNQQGFSYGNVTTDGANNGTSFWWENGNENHALPYTEVYIRRISAIGSKALDLADMVRGGDGTGTGAGGNALDPRNGNVISGNPGGLSQPNDTDSYSTVGAYGLVDGVFIPDGGAGNVTLNSNGDTYASFPNTDSNSWDYIEGGPNQGSGSAFAGVSYASNMIGLHGNKGITFDLDAVRAANPGFDVVRFTAVAGNAAGGAADFWVFLDGALQDSRTGITSGSQGSEVDIPIAPGDQFLTLVSTDAGNGYSFDQILFGAPKLTLAPTSTGVIPEPMTMLAVGLGVAGLGGYVRKRRKA